MDRLLLAAPFILGAIAQALLLALLLRSARTSRIGRILLFACGSTAVAATAFATDLAGVFSVAGTILELGAIGSWCAFLIWLLIERASKQAYFVRALALVFLVLLITAFGCAVLASAGQSWNPLIQTLASYSRIGIAVIGLLATENLYRNTDPEYRWHINFLCVALAGMFAYAILIYADALLFRRVSTLLWAGRGIVIAVAAPLVAVAAARNRNWAIDIHVSRRVVFHSASLVGSGMFLVALAAAGEIFRAIGPGWGDVAEMTLLIVGVAAVAIMASSGAARSYLRRLIADNFYSTRYDYRQEWLKSIEILSGTTKRDSVQTRVIKAVAEVADSPSGVLWVRDVEGSDFNWAGSWNQPATSIAEPAEGGLISLFRDGNWVVELDENVRKPEWYPHLIDPWMAVPLSDKGDLIGFVVLSRSRAPFKFDRESFDLLRIVAKQAGVHIAEQRNAKALAQSKELGNFAKRFAFVAHDVKNVSSQLAMILQNARTHGEDPLFHQDVLATVQAAHDRLKKLLFGLSSTRGPSVNGVISPVELLKEELAIIARRHGNDMIPLQHDGRNASVSMDADAFRSVITHLCDNAIEASASPVEVRVRHQPMRVEIEIADHGSGMTPEFIRDRLFEPFGSTKPKGMGIGAYQARELIRAAGGDLLVTSQPGLGTTMRILLPSLGITSEPALLQSEEAQ